MMNFQNLHEARIHVQEMSEDATIEIGDASVMEYSNGEIEIVEIGEAYSDESDVPLYLGKVCEVLY